VSQALKIHGPNYGVGGGNEGAAEALLVAGALLADGLLPGLWVVLTGFDPELVPADPLAADAAPPRTDCLAVALALTPPGDGAGGVSLSVRGAGRGDTHGGPVLSLERLAETLAADEPFARWMLPCGGWAAWERVGAAAEVCL